MPSNRALVNCSCHFIFDLIKDCQSISNKYGPLTFHFQSTWLSKSIIYVCCDWSILSGQNEILFIHQKSNYMSAIPLVPSNDCCHSIIDTIYCMPLHCQSQITANPLDLAIPPATLTFHYLRKLLPLYQIKAAAYILHLILISCCHSICNPIGNYSM